MKLVNYELMFDSSEFIMLSLILGATQIVGIDDYDNISQMNDEQLTVKWDETKQKLIDAGHIKISAIDTVEVDDYVYSILHHYIQSKMMHQIQIFDSEKQLANDTLYYYNDSILVLKTEQDDETETSRVVVPVPDNDVSLETMIHKYVDYSCPDIFNPDACIIDLTKEEYDRCISSIASKDASTTTEILVAAGMDEELAKDAADSFINVYKLIVITSVHIGNSEEEPMQYTCYMGKKYAHTMAIFDNEECTIQIHTLSSKLFWEQINALSEEGLE